ncbi:C-type lectin domain family 4 member M-like isoform X1 [Salvelinus fontinalis]|uniref:C-type lectin domain family 4 member M-like isoform X1 n=1 Tax=Salvelinus fontinalis TaxID=8038 RepID=UPI002486378B|nr:C-type lectin domain family 4 member M-like isoform X1 [Salvelinus fontinalis]XP_055765946.1 C-type lectin domain family 4 member M-like isoform X1 [Salvelinus fontinalis]XP_055765947.1 C-type lectin domain family 4 member M-like isoform X1 [Salvelinus fontinalis]
MSEGVYEITDGFRDDEPDAMKNTDIDGQLYGNVGAFKPSPRNGVVSSGKIAFTHTQLQTHIEQVILPCSATALFVPILYDTVKHITKDLTLIICDSVHVQWWKRPSGVAAVCLGLLCVLLLAGIIGLSVYYVVIGHHNSTERGQLQTSYNALTEERGQLQTSYNALTEERDQLQSSYNSLTKERDQLQSSCNTLTKERVQLQTERDFLNGRFTNLKQTCPEGWQKFESSWYFLSIETKTWKESREDCLERGADLVIINSREEQTFLFNLQMRAWIGLDDSVTEGTWKWVDGTPLTTGYWRAGQPDDSGQEDCAEIYYGQDDPVQTWNDDKCGTNHNWICEKVV